MYYWSYSCCSVDRPLGRYTASVVSRAIGFVKFVDDTASMKQQSRSSLVSSCGEVQSESICTQHKTSGLQPGAALSCTVERDRPT
jgi:hypothetical protein